MAREYQCEKCGGDMMGDGYTRALVCEFVPETDEVDAREADADPLYCSLEEDHNPVAEVQSCATT